MASKVVDLSTNNNGNLVISVYDREELEIIDQRDTYGEMKLLEALEYQLHNEDMAYTCDISDWGNLSNAPGIITGLSRDDYGVPTDFKELYWYPNYMVSDCFQKLLEYGEVVFSKVN